MPKWIKKNVDFGAPQIKWNKPWMIDIISPTEFDRECKHTLSSHECAYIRCPDRPVAKFIKTVNKDIAILDYTDKRVKAYNKRHDMVMGKYKIIFTSPKRTTVKEVIWIDDNGIEHRNAAKTS